MEVGRKARLSVGFRFHRWDNDSWKADVRLVEVFFKNLTASEPKGSSGPRVWGSYLCRLQAAADTP